MTVMDLVELAEPRLRVLERTTSSNDEVRSWLERGGADGVTVIVDFQTRGRGRLGRSWSAPAGVNLNLSQGFRAPGESLRLLPVLGALAVRQAVARFLPPVLRVGIKWPNDIVVLGRKLAGILAESFSLGGGPAAVLGIGVNLNTAAGQFPTGLRRPAASLRMLGGRRVERAGFARELLDTLTDWRRVWRERPRRLVAEFAAHCITIGRRVRVEPPGREHFIGLACSVDPTGQLLVSDEQGATHLVTAGDVVDIGP